MERGRGCGGYGPDRRVRGLPRRPGFSLASTLREQGWGGRLIAAGDVLPDQARHLKRSGFDAVELAPGADPDASALDAGRLHHRLSAGRRSSRARMATAGRRSSLGHTRGIRRARRLGSRDRSGRLGPGLNLQLAGADAGTVLRAVLDPALGLSVAVLSSFGSEAAVLLDHVAAVDAATPVLFLDTGQHFIQTLGYRRQLSDHLGLSDVRIVLPEARERAAIDPAGDLWRTQPDACCDLRKVRPLARAAAGFNALITGRKRHQTEGRRALDVVEVLDGSLRINPLVAWDSARIAAHLAARDLPAHPLVDQGYASIGCWPCTRAVEAFEPQRAGRWSGVDKVECGIHLGRRRAAA